MSDKEIIIRWILTNVDEDVVPLDEGNGDALVYNMVMLAIHGKNHPRWNDNNPEIVDEWRSGKLPVIDNIPNITETTDEK